MRPRTTRPYASQYDYFARLDAVFAAVEATYNDAAWEALSCQEQLEALGIGARRLPSGQPLALQLRQRAMRARNAAAVLDVLRTNPNATNREIGALTGLSYSGVVDNIRYLYRTNRLRRESARIRRAIEAPL